jgi:protein-tyrosine sulfotransferase
MIRPPIFLGGAGRSGTTLLRVILDSHPDIACGPEFKLIPGIALHWARAIKEFRPVLESYAVTPQIYNNAYRTLIESLLGPYLARSGKKRIAEKTPNNVLFFYHLSRIFPDSPLVHLVRDGRDVVCSLLTMDWKDPLTGAPVEYTRNAERAANYWVEAVNAGRRAGESMEVRRNYYEIRYEDIVEKPEPTLRALFEFLGEPWDRSVLDFHSRSRELAGESSAEQVSRGIYRSSVGRWKEQLKEADKETVKRIAGDLLIRLGYAADGNW